MRLIARLLPMVMVFVVCVPPARATPAFLIPPVDGAVTRCFERPGTEWGRGHRGMDLAVEPGAQIRAAAAGRVTFAGSVAGVLAVTIAHGHGLESTYSRLSAIEVGAGDIVGEGQWLGRAGTAHDDTVGLHFGVKLHGEYVDPEEFIGPLDISGAIHLAPLLWEPPETFPSAFRLPLVSAEGGQSCITPDVADANAPPPNDNIVVLVAGIGSRTAGQVSAEIYESTARKLGYPEAKTYRFSYRGSNDASLHEPYSNVDTFGDIRGAASRLRTLLEKVAARHPGASVDLVAHSQGGVVARSFLQLHAGAWDASLPPVEHLLTFATPHTGAPLAGARGDVEATTGGRLALRGASWAAHHGAPIPDPLSPAVGQLAPGSPLMEDLAGEAVLFGTRVLTLAIPNDLVVPADRARWAPYAHAVAPPRGLNGHDAIVTSPVAVGAARTFLRDGPPVCREGWDLWGPPVGRTVSFLERNLPRLYRFGRRLIP